MPADFGSLCVLSLENRRAQEIAKLIANSGGLLMVVSSVREVRLASNREALDFAGQLAEGRVDMAIFMTGVGVAAIARSASLAYLVPSTSSAPPARGHNVGTGVPINYLFEHLTETMSEAIPLYELCASVLA